MGIFTAKGRGRCLEPKRSLTEARGRCARRGHFQQALGRRHTQGGWQHQRHGGPPGTDPAVPAHVGPEAGSLRCAAQLAECGRVFWMSGTDAVGRTLLVPRKHPSRVAPVSG